MVSSYSPSLKLELMATGDQSGTWGDTTNTNLGTLLEQAITGYIAVAQGDVANKTLTSLNGASDEARNMVVDITGAMTAARNVVVPTAEKIYLAKNSTTGGFAVTFKTTAGTGIAVPAGQTRWLFCDGTNVLDGLPSYYTAGGTDVAIADGGTGQGTPNLPDGTWRWANTADATKLVAFDVSLGATATTRTIKFPAVSGTLAALGPNVFTGAQQWAEGAAIAAASTLVLGTDGNMFHVTGVVAIGALSGAASPVTLVFDSTPVLTHNATTLILPGNANITAAAGDVAVFVFEGGTSWRCVSYQRLSESPPLSGTFTPALTFGGASVGVAYAANGQIGRYVRVGNKVTVWIYIITTSIGSSTGTAAIAGLPFVAKTVTGMVWTSGVGYRSVPFTAAGVTSGSSAINLYNGATAISDTSFVASSEVAITLEYECA